MPESQATAVAPTPARELVDQLLSRIPPDEHDKLVLLMVDAPKLVQSLIGKRPHKSSLWRNAAHGSAGVRLRCAQVGKARYTTARWLCEFWLDVAEARAKPGQSSKRSKAPARRRTRRKKRKVTGR